MFETLKKNYPQLNIVDTTYKSRLFFKLDIDASELMDYSQTVAAGEENTYTASDSVAEKFTVVKTIAREVFAQTAVQAGWCCGGGATMNGMEWHKSSEVIIACTDMLLLLGDFFDIDKETYDSNKALGLYIKKGETVELLPLTLHFAPLKVSGLFKAAIILPECTNLPLHGGANGSLRAVNKWLLVHPEYKKGVLSGGKIGISGKNIEII